MSQEFETWFQEIENQIAAKWDSLLDLFRSSQHIDESARYLAALTAALLYVRSNAMREQLNDMSKEMLMKMLELDDPGLHKRVTEANLSISFSNAVHLRFIQDTLVGTANVFFEKRWEVLVARGTNQFVTTCNPVTEWTPPQFQKLFWGNSMLHRQQHFPMAPDVFAILSMPPTPNWSGKNPKRYSLFRNEDNRVRILNAFVSDRSDSGYAYATKDGELDEILEELKRPGTITAAYREAYPASRLP